VTVFSVVAFLDSFGNLFSLSFSVAVAAQQSTPVPPVTPQHAQQRAQTAAGSASLNTHAVEAVKALFTLAAAAAAIIIVISLYSALCSPQDPAPATSHSTSVLSTWVVKAVQGLSFVLVGAVFLALRLGTLRVYAPAGTSSNSTDADHYNHRETDERVFEVGAILPGYVAL
jgi:hypothetical protein